MSMYDPSTGRPVPLEYGGVRDSAVVRFFNAVYAWMAVGLAVTASVAWIVAHNPAALKAVLNGPAMIGIVIAELILVVTISAAVRRVSASLATVLFVAYSALNGLLFSTIFLVYAHGVIASAFVACAAMFAVMSLYGMFTKTDLTSLGKILFMALIGLVIATIVNMFWWNGVFTMMVSYLGVVVFAGLTAYDTQRLKAVAVATEGNPAMAARLSVNGALELYLDFVNMFLFILRIMGDRR